MAVSVSRVTDAQVPKFRTVTDVTLDSSYLEGGEALTAEQLGLASVDRADCFIKNGSESEEWVGFAFYEPAKALIHLYSVKTGKEVASTKDMSKVVVRVVAMGSARAK